MKRTVRIAALLYGFTAMSSQIVFLREFLVVFYGNEISVGIILAGWLVCGGAGSILFGRFADRSVSRILLLSLCQILLAFSLPASFFLVRSGRSLMGISPGEIVGILPMSGMIFATLILPCVIMGFMFTLFCRVYRDLSSTETEAVAHVYVLEAVGALFGGVLVSYLLIRFMSHMDVIFLLFLLNVFFPGFLVFRSDRILGKGLARRFLRILTVASILFSVFVMATGLVERFEGSSISRLWANFNILGSRDSLYGNITVTESFGEISFYENGLHLYTVPDAYSAEENVHFALLQSPDPSRVLLLGGGLGGRLEELLKHPVETIDYLELDPKIIKMAEKYLSPRYTKFLRDPRVRVINRDGREFVKNSQGEYEVIMLGIGDPYTAQINRFYTVNFFREAERVLSDDGILCFSLTSSENYVGEELGRYLASIRYALKEVFPEVMVIPGDTAHFFASKRPGGLLRCPGDVVHRIEERGLDTLYVNAPYIEYRMSPSRMEYIDKVLRGFPSRVLNTDFRPVSYFYAIAFWNTHFAPPGPRSVMDMFSPLRVWFSGILFAVFVVFFAVISGKRHGKQLTLTAVTTTGFSEITFQLAIIIAFQSIYGFVFGKIGVIVTSFMVGLALGGWTMAMNMKRVEDPPGLFLKIQGAICVYPLLLPPVFFLLANMRGPFMAWAGSNIIFAVLPSVAGFMGGVQFPVACKIHLSGEDSLGHTAGLCYGLDLVGACLGALITGAFLMPVLGIPGTCFFVALVNGAVFLALAENRRASFSSCCP